MGRKAGQKKANKESGELKWRAYCGLFYDLGLAGLRRSGWWSALSGPQVSHQSTRAGQIGSLDSDCVMDEVSVPTRPYTCLCREVRRLSCTSSWPLLNATFGRLPASHDLPVPTLSLSALLSSGFGAGCLGLLGGCFCDVSRRSCSRRHVFCWTHRTGDSGHKTPPRPPSP
jgi:hypothetical protein